jgi:hypothetical protein
MDAMDTNTLGYLYAQHFNPSSPYERLLSFGAHGCPKQQFKIATYLQSNVTYILAVTTYWSKTTNNFSILVSGPSNATFNQISKSNILLAISLLTKALPK